MKKVLVFAAMLAAVTGFLSHRSEVAASIVYTGGNYSQNFDGLPNSGNQTLTGRGPHAFSDLTNFSISGMGGWYFANPSGSSTSTEFRAQDGSLSGSAGRGVVSFGLTGDSNRALGALSTSNQINSFGAVFVNNTGGTLTSATISFFGEQWRRGDAGVSNTLSFQYGNGSSINDATIAFSGLNFSTLDTSGGNSAINGNQDANRQLISATINGLDWQNGASFAVRWNMNDVSGQDTGLAIDNFQFSAVPEPSALLLVGSVLGAGFLRRRRS